MKINSKKRALFSLFDQRNSLSYAKQLISLGWEIVASKETVDILKKNHIPVMDISNFLKIKTKYPFPPTLHPYLELALSTNIGKSIDLVYVSTYPLSQGNDVGGHTMLALAAKGKKIVIWENEDMRNVLQRLKKNNNQVSPFLRKLLIDKVHDKIIDHYLSLKNDSQFRESKKIIIGKKIKNLLEGENPYQIPCSLFQTNKKDNLGLPNFKQIAGIKPCYTNMADFDCLVHTLCLLTEAFSLRYKKIPYIVIASKHGNPIGFAVDWENPQTAIENALFGHPVAMFGGEVITNFSITQEFARMLVSSPRRKRLLGNPNWMPDLIIASDFHRDAVKILAQRKRLKLFKNEKLVSAYLNEKNWSYREVRGGFLRQPPNDYVLDLNKVIKNTAPVDAIYVDSLIIAWAAAWNSSLGGNEVAIAKNRMLLGIGGGPATIDSCYSAINRAKNCGHNLKNSSFAANAFFPFTDAPAELVKSGCIYGLVPSGGKNFELIKKYFTRKGAGVFYLPEQFRGFSRH
ncbi:MAG: hypothetical protein NTX01_02260 [Candidatus Omnitrophica bacterium]|nr:hypothetical protein [Candidatus Omnitrophota bacterium]